MKKTVLIYTLFLVLQVIFEFAGIAALYAYSYQFSLGGILGKISGAIMLSLVVLLQASPLTAAHLLATDRISKYSPQVSAARFIFFWAAINAIIAGFHGQLLRPIGDVPVSSFLSNAYFFMTWGIGNIFYAGASFVRRRWGELFITRFSVIALLFFPLALLVPTFLQYHYLQQSYVSDQSWLLLERREQEEWNNTLRELHRIRPQNSPPSIPSNSDQ